MDLVSAVQTFRLQVVEPLVASPDSVFLRLSVSFIDLCTYLLANPQGLFHQVDPVFRLLCPPQSAYPKRLHELLGPREVRF